MTPPDLARLARECGLEDDDRPGLRLAFGIACVERVEQLLTEDSVIECLRVGKRFVAGEADEAELREAARLAADLAARHPGSNSLDGSGNAAVSASFGVAAALAGRALAAAGYAAYAKVYSYASYAVTDPASYAEEHAWQLEKLRSLQAGEEGG